MSKTSFFGAAFAVSLSLSVSPVANSQDQLISEIRILPYAFCPADWVALDGNMLLVSDNPALFSLIGCTYGGNCSSTFSMPDARGRVLVQNGLSPDGLTYQRGMTLGQEITTDVAKHTHSAVMASGGTGVLSDPAGAYVAGVNVVKVYKAPPVASQGNMADGTIGVPTGAPDSVSNMQPSSVINYCMATDGIYPQRD